MKKALLCACLAVNTAAGLAQNPIVSHCYTADPAPMVFEGNDSLYVYCDEDMNIPGVHDFYYMDVWRVYSTVDMVNWTDHGLAMPRAAFAWAKEGTAWASQCVKSGNTYYWYMCAQKKEGWVHHIGVGKSDKPSGPFKDARKAPLISTNTGGDIDPTVFIDDNGDTYLYWGNNKVCYAKLRNMLLISNASENNGIVEIPLTKESFGGVKVDDKVVGDDCYEEGPWLDKRGDNYYLIYAAGGVPEHISYAMSKSPQGPWEYKGQVMTQQNTGSFTNHSGIVNYKGQDYFFYHTGWAKGGGGFNRSMSVEKMYFNADGTIKPVTATHKGVEPLCTMNPYLRQQAETMNVGIGVKVVGDEKTGVYVTDIHQGDSIRVRNVDFGNDGAESITVRVASNGKAGNLLVRQDNARGLLLAKLKVPNTGGADVWEEINIPLNLILKGVHDVHFSFTGKPADDETTLFNFDWWKFTSVDEANAIRNVETKTDDGIFYDLTGRQVDTPQHGIYIKNGKKVSIK